MVETTYTSTPSTTVPLAIPSELARIWTKLAARELARGRRDLGSLVEATLQFAMDQGNKHLLPLAQELGHLENWLLYIDRELENVQATILKSSYSTLRVAYQRRSIRMNKEAKNGSTIVVSVEGEPTFLCSDLQQYIAVMQKQREQVQQAVSNQTSVLQARQARLTDMLRSYLPELQRSAREMIANAPPLSQKRPTQAIRKEVVETAVSLTPPRPERTLAGVMLSFSIWINPMTHLRAWLEALLAGYHADPYVSPEELLEILPEPDQKPKKPKVYTI